MAELTITTSEGTRTVHLGHESTITIDSPGGDKGTPVGATRMPHTFARFKVGEAYPPGFRRVSALVKRGRAVLVTEAGTPADTHPSYPDDPWTKTMKVPVDDASVLVLDGNENTRIPLAGLTKISLD